MVKRREGDRADAGSRSPGVRGIRRHLERVLGSPDFDASRRSRQFLEFIVEETLAGRGDGLSQGLIASRVFERGDDFDPVLDPIVRIQAGRLRRSLERYYLLSGRMDEVRVDLPKGTYVPVFRTVVAAPAAEPRRRALDAPNGWPSVVVRPFETDLGPRVGPIAGPLEDELALELGRYGAVRVVRSRDWEAQDSASRERRRFLLEGRIGGPQSELRVSARLVDRMSGEQVWADEYRTRPVEGGWSPALGDVARVIAARVGAEEGVVVQHLAAERRKSPDAGQGTAYDAFLRSYDFFLARDPEAFAPAVEALRRAVAAEPECGLAWTRLARLYVANHVFEVAGPPASLDEAVTCAQRGVRVDPADRSARCVLASALLYKGELTAAREQLEEALRTSPDSLVYLEIVGYLLVLVGSWERGEATCRAALARNPHCLPHVLFGLWVCHLRRGEFEAAHGLALEYRDPTFFWRSVMRASSLGLLGREAEARSEGVALLGHKPDFQERGRALISHHIKFPEVMEPIVLGLARAGVRLA